MLSSYYHLFESAPVAAAILEAKTLKIEMANDAVLNIWARECSARGNALLEVLPEIVDQPYPEVLHQVGNWGIHHEEQGAKVKLFRHGKMEDVFMELNKLALEESDRNLRAIVMSAPVPMCVVKGAHFEATIINDHMLDLWKEQRTMNLAALHHVFHHGVPYTMVEKNITFSFTPLRNGDGSMLGVSVIATYVGK